MPIGGFVIHVRPESEKTLLSTLRDWPGIEVHGHDNHGGVAVVIEAESSKTLQDLVKKIGDWDPVLNIGLTYLNVEDEVEGIGSGDSVTGIFHGIRLESSPL